MGKRGSKGKGKKGGKPKGKGKGVKLKGGGTAAGGGAVAVDPATAMRHLATVRLPHIRLNFFDGKERTGGGMKYVIYIPPLFPSNKTTLKPTHNNNMHKQFLELPHLLPVLSGAQPPGPPRPGGSGSGRGGGKGVRVKPGM